MSDERVVLLSVEGHIATITLNRPKQLNALNQQVLVQLGQVLDEIEKTPDIRAVLLVGEGRAFAAGADITEMHNHTAVEAEYFSRLGQRVFTRLEQLAQPVIALIQGYVLGGGLELAMAATVRIAAEDAKFGQPEVNLGVTPGFAGTQRLPRLVGQGRALHLLLSGEQIDGIEAYRIGLVTQIVPAEQLLETGRKYAEKLASLAPHALRLVKKAVYEGAEVDLDRGAALESSLFGLCFSTNDQTEGMSAFIERRKPSFQGR